MPTRTREPASLDALHHLRDVLDAAMRVAGDLANDPLLSRLLEAFRLMPMEDRSIVVTAIEREVQARRLSRATEAVTGQAMHPNPNARLYVRSHENTVPRNLLERDELTIAMLAAFRVTPILEVPEIHAEWLDATRAALKHLEPATRAVVSRLMREGLALAEAVEAAATVGHAKAS